MVPLRAHIIQFQCLVHVVRDRTVLEPEHVRWRQFVPRLADGDTVDREDGEDDAQCEGAERNTNEETKTDRGAA